MCPFRARLEHSFTGLTLSTERFLQPLRQMKPVPDYFCWWGGGGVRQREMLVLFLFFFSLSRPQFLVYLLKCSRFTVLCQFQMYSTVVQLSIYISVCLRFYISIFLSVFLFLCLSIFLYFHLCIFIYISIYLYFYYISIYLSLSPSVYPSILFHILSPLPVSWSCVLKGRC